jgi:hypothetical protein
LLADCWQGLDLSRSKSSAQPGMLGLLDASDRMLEKRWQKCDVTSGEALPASMS